MPDNASKPSEKRDLFAQIASERAQEQKASLIEPVPPAVKKKTLSTVHRPSAAFRPAAGIDGPDALQKELDRQRKNYKTFLQDLAPRPRPTRVKLELRKFDWRMATPADEADFVHHTLPGRGAWQTVTIPHYGGPLGRATAYYRTSFQVSRKQIRDKRCWICFKGVDYKAQVFINGSFVGNHEGFFAPFEFDFTAVAKDGRNVLVVKVENDAICMGNDSWNQKVEGDKIYAATGPGYDDPQVGWHHCPPGMGIYQDVTMEVRPEVFVQDIFVRPIAGESRAEAWIEVFNHLPLSKTITLDISLFGQNFPKTVFRGRACPLPGPAGPGVNYYRIPFDIPNAKIWDLDSPWLYQLQACVKDSETGACDVRTRQFGMRSFTLDETSEPRGMFYLNGRRIKLRGTNTMGFEQQDVIKGDYDQLIDDILLAKICNMNFWRLTQRPVQEAIYDYCDRLGLMTQTDLPLFGVLRRNQFCEAVRQAGQMERLIRAHPSNVAITYINEPFPDAWEKPHRHLLRHELESFFTAADQAVRLENPDRVIKHVDGDYDPPAAGLPDNHCYTLWYNGHGVPIGKLIQGYWQKVKPGWNYACGEFGAEGLDPAETMYKYYPKEWLPKRPQDEWSPERIIQSQTKRFHYMWFTTPRTLPEWVRESQEHQAWATQTMTEAFRLDPRMVSFAIHLFIDAFPSGWMKAIMDCDRHPKPAYFAYRRALAPVAASIRTDRTAYFGGEKMRLDFWVCNDWDRPLADHTLCYQIRRGGRVVFSQKVPAAVPALAPSYQGTLAYPLPKVTERTELAVEVAIKDRAGKIVDNTCRTFDVFPKPAAKPAPVFVLGGKDSAAWRLAAELGLRPLAWQQGAIGTVLTSSLKDVLRHQKELLSAIHPGGRLILTDLELDEKDRNKKFQLAGAKVVFHPPGMNQPFFVNCQTGHPWLAGFRKNDLFMWHSTETDRIEPILPLTMEAEGMETLLLTGNGTWQSTEWTAQSAAAVKRWGQGYLIVSLVSLLHRTQTNPPARDYALRLFGSAD